MTPTRTLNLADRYDVPITERIESFVALALAGGIL